VNQVDHQSNHSRLADFPNYRLCNRAWLRLKYYSSLKNGSGLPFFQLPTLKFPAGLFSLRFRQKNNLFPNLRLTIKFSISILNGALKAVHG
jgi:hypothetical protein